MAIDIIDINKKSPHKLSEVICTECKYRWISVRPKAILLKELECAKCHKQGYVIETGEVMN